MMLNQTSTPGKRNAIRPGTGGFTLVELLVTLGIFAIIYAGVHGFFTSTWTAWRRGNERRPLYQVGLGIVDSITRDARAAKSTTGTTWNSSGYLQTLVFNYPARFHVDPINGNHWHQKRVKYQNTSSGFKRVIETGDTPTETGSLSSGTPRYTSTEWLLTRYLANWEWQNPDLFGSYPRILWIYFYLHKNGTAAWPNYQYRLYARVWIRRDTNVSSTVSY